MADYVGTSLGDNGQRIAEMWGGTGNGSWINTPLPDNTAVHAGSQRMVDDIVQNVHGTLTGRSTAAYPYINIDTFTATVNVVPADQPLVPVFIAGSQADPAKTWAFARNGMAEAGFPIPDGLEPTLDPRTGNPDSDGTIVIYQPDYVWPGRPGDTRYHGRYYELWGAASPAQNQARNFQVNGQYVWTAKQPGRMLGVNNYKHAHGFSNFGSDVTNKSNPLFVASAPYMDPVRTRTYPGYGSEGVATEYTMFAPASKIPFSHTVIQLRDLARTDPDTGRQGYIDHAIGYMLASVPTTIGGVPTGLRGTSVWPAQLYDTSSRSFMPHGTRLRFPHDIVMNESWSDIQYAIVKCIRDYGMFFGDTTGGGLTLRMEPGAWGYLPAGFNRNAFMKTIPWNLLEGMQVGSDAVYNVLGDEDPEEPPVDPPPPAPGSLRAGHGRFRGSRLT